MKKILKFVFHRMVIAALLMILQLTLLIVMILRFENYFSYFYAFSILLSIVVVVRMVGQTSDPAYKIAWIIPIMAVPVFGGFFYLMFGTGRLSHHSRKKLSAISEKMKQVLKPSDALLETLEQQDPQAAIQARYIQQYAGAPLSQATTVEYLPLGEVKFQRMVEELEKARHYIFMEYFIIEEGIMWNTVREILVRKAAEGVDVRLIYDDMGSIMTVPAHYARQLEKQGIHTCVFNPFIPVLNSRLNNRDHRKICVIDGHTGFTGGINLADEYINAYPKHGHWKDTAILLKGEAVWNLTVMFLSMWDYIRGNQETDYERYRPSTHLERRMPDDGIVIPFADSPLDDEAVGETVYMNLINRAKRYVYITTPYLIISDEMIEALCRAAKGGVDVRIITPHVADKWYVHAVTRAYYKTLIQAGVKIFEYTPGFIHAKSFVVDDCYGVVGTINLDYRSLYLHFECATWMYGCACLKDLKEDFLATQAVSGQVTLETCRKVRFPSRVVQSLLRVFAPLM